MDKILLENLIKDLDGKCKSHEDKLKEELNIYREFIRANNLECDVMAYYGRSDEGKGKE